MITQLLIDHGAAVDVAASLGTTPLDLAVFFGNEGAVQQLLDAKADPNRHNEKNVCCLFYLERL